MSARKMAVVALLLTAPLAGAPLACDGGETVNPLPVGTTTTETTTGAPEPAPTGVPPKRTVSMRNPLGGPPGNLLVDGDFELSVSLGGGQYGFRSFNAAGTSEVPLTVETGGLCRSGLACVRFQKGQLLFGRGTAAAGGKGHVFSMFARLPEGVSCTQVDVLAVECDTFKVLAKASPDDDLDEGWCRYTGTFGPSTSAACLYVTNQLDAGAVAVVDAAVLAPNDGTVPYQYAPDEPLDPEAIAAMARVRDLVRRTTRFGRPAVTAPRDGR